MSADLIIDQAAAARELEQRRAERAALETELAGRESELVALKAELRAFERRYLETVGRRYAELDEIEARLAEAEGLNPEETAEGWAVDELSCGQARFQFTEKLKKLYREVARRFHPDLAADDEERHHRHQLMIEVNRAYEAGSEERLQELLDAGMSFQELGQKAGASAELALTLRQIAQARGRLMAIDAEMAEIKASEIYRLKVRAEQAEALGRDLLADLAAQIERQIAKARSRLVNLQGVELAD
jgi:hypothetical protein